MPSYDPNDYPLGQKISKITGIPLYTVQLAALDGGYGKPGYAFFMEMGLGKTRTVLAEYAALAMEGRADYLVVVVPNSLKGSWAKEARDLSYPYELEIYSKKPKEQKAQLDQMLKSKKPRVIVVNYEMLLSSFAPFLSTLIANGQVYIALDESIRIKNPKSKVGKKLQELFKGEESSHFRRVLSGRPAPQGVHDLWGQFRFIGLMETLTFFQFRNMYCAMGGWMGKKVVGAINLDKLRARTGHGVFRAKKMEWTDLPSKLPPVTRRVEMLPVQREAYLRMMHDFVLEWGERHITVEMAVSAKQKLAQISTGFIYDEGTVHWLMGFADNPKLNDLEEFIDSVENKVIVFYHHKPAKEAIEALLLKRQEDYLGVILESGLKVEEIEERKRLFNEDPKYKVIFCQSSAHKYGHTLLGLQDTMPCYTTYFFENTYNLDTRVQSEDRNHRHGQRYPVSYYDVAMCREDMLTIEALQRKDRLEDALMKELTGGNIEFDIQDLQEW